VVAYDPAAGAEKRLREMVTAVWPTLERLGLQTNAHPERLHFAESLATAVQEAQFVQESVPEKLALKQETLAQIDTAAPPNTIIASSTSGYAMTDLQSLCGRPQRTVVGHPFNPPYLIPLVEVVGGAKTEAAVVDWAMEFYTAVHKHPLKLSREVPGFVANRLQEAMWREALHMVNEGLATVEEIDAAIVHGPGLRWPIMGPILTFHLAGGEGGMGYMLDHFDPGLFADWTKLAAPPITAELRQKMVEGCVREADGRTIQQLEQERDRTLIAILEAIEK
jgi:carnitine 3-dehydrogenase